jgi:hypothetical protein
VRGVVGVAGSWGLHVAAEAGSATCGHAVGGEQVADWQQLAAGRKLGIRER